MSSDMDICKATYLNSYTENVLDSFRQLLFNAALIAISVIALLALLIVLADIGRNYKRFRRSGVGALRAISGAFRSLFVYTLYETEEGQLGIERLTNRKTKPNVKLPEGIAVIGEKVFLACSFNSVTLPGSLRVIGKGAFERTMLREIVIPKGTEKIDDLAFAYSIFLERVEMPFVADISDRAFWECGRIKSFIVDGHELYREGTRFGRLFWYECAAVLAADGNRDALGYVEGKAEDMLKRLTCEGSDKALGALLSLPVGISAEEIDRALETAITNELHEKYILLVRYKAERTGSSYDTTSEERFEL